MVKRQKNIIFFNAVLDAPFCNSHYMTFRLILIRDNLLFALEILQPNLDLVLILRPDNIF